jgi:hypothetical protein
LVGATLSVGLAVGAAGMTEAAPISSQDPAATAVGDLLTAEVAKVYSCTDAQGSTIGPEDGVNIKGIQKAVGAYADGVFGKNGQTCDLLWEELIEEGHLTGSGDNPTLKVGTTVLKWLGVPASTPEAPTSTTTTSSTNTEAKNKPTPCGNMGKCIEVHQVDGLNVLELFDVQPVTINGKTYQQSVRVDKTFVNTGKQGMRTRNGNFTTFDETFANDGIRPSYAPDGSVSSGRMGDPIGFSGSPLGVQRFHWRVNYQSVGGKTKKNLQLMPTDHPEYENTSGFGGYASSGCVHVPRWFLEKYDILFFEEGVSVLIKDQPKS